MDSQNSNKERLWEQCPEGMLRNVADRRAGEHRLQQAAAEENQFDRRQLLQLAGAVAVSVGAGTLAYRSLYPHEGPNQTHPMANWTPTPFDGVTCDVCIANLQNYMQKSIDEQKLVAKMDEHLKICPSCRAKLDEMRSS